MKNQNIKQKKVDQIDALREKGTHPIKACKQVGVKPGTYYDWKRTLEGNPRAGRPPAIHDAQVVVKRKVKKPTGNIIALAGSVESVTEALQKLQF